MFPTKMNMLIFILIGFFAGIGTTLLFPRTADIAPWEKKVVKVSTQEKTAAQHEQQYQQQLTTLNKDNTNLQQQVQDTRKALNASRQKARRLAGQLAVFLDKPPLWNGDTLVAPPVSDTALAQVSDYIGASTTQDSLCDALNTALQQQVDNRDSSIALQEQRYRDLQFSFTQSMEQQQVLQDQSKFYQRQAKRNKVKNKLLSAGMLILAGVSGYALISR